MKKFIQFIIAMFEIYGEALASNGGDSFERVAQRHTCEKF